MDRSILHIRHKDFEIQAERRIDPSLRTRAIAIISSGKQDGTVLQLSREAYSEGLQVGMKVSLVRKMSHSVTLSVYNQKLYAKINQHIYKIIKSFSPLVEPSSLGQYYLDMSGMEGVYKSIRQAASTILTKVRQSVDVASAIGISSNKLVSRISTLVAPEPLFEVYTGQEPHFMAPLISKMLPVVKEKAVARVIDFLLLRKIRDVQVILDNPDSASVLFGKFYQPLDLQARGKDYSMVLPPIQKPHILKYKVLDSGTNNGTILYPVVCDLAGQLGYDLRRRSIITLMLNLEIHYDDGFCHARKIQAGCNDEKTLAQLCLELFYKTNQRRNRIRSIILDATGLKPVARQTDLFRAEDNSKEIHLSQAVDNIRTRFGMESIKSAAVLMKAVN